MSFTVGGSTPQLTFADATVQNTAALPLTGGSVSADITVNGLTVGKGGGSNNTLLGNGAGNTTANYLTAIGYAAGASTTDNNFGSTFVGRYSGNLNTSGIYNTAVGQTSLGANTTGANNTAVGDSALKSNTTASNNTAVGYQAGYAANGADGLAFFGTYAGKSTTTGSAGTAVGYAALISNTTGSANTAMGWLALYSNTTASNNTAVGYQAGYSNTTGGGNAIFGYQSGYSVTTGSGNTLIGSGSGNYGTGITTGNNNTIIGNNSSVSAVGDSQSIIIGQGVTGKGTNTGFINPNSGGVYQGNNSASWSTTSDRRLKKNIVDNNTGLIVINQIQVRNFECRLSDEITELPQDQAIQKQGVQLGVIAQELQAVLPECVKTESTGVMTVDTDNLTWYMINAIKELSAEVKSLKSQLKGA